MEDYVECVVFETYTADASGVSTTPASESAASGCGTSANVPLPPMCGYTAWTCPITNLPTGWVNNGQTVTIPDSASSTNVTLNVEMRLASWTNHLIKTVQQPVNVAAAIAGATNGYKLYNEDYFGGRFWDVWAAYDACQDRGGDLATLSEAASSGVLGTASQYYGQKEGSTTRPVNTSSDWDGTSGTDYKAAQDGGSQKYISSRSSASYVCETKSRTGTGCGFNGSSTKYYVCKNLPSCD
jgi:hypothetical protein